MPQMLHDDGTNGSVEEKFLEYKRLSNRAN